jgi:hypothetical protein
MEAARDWIQEVDFPATKLQLIDTAADAGEPQEVVERLQQLSLEQYESRDELRTELDEED